MSNYTEAGRPPDVAADAGNTQRSKGLAKGRLGLLASVVLGISTIAPVYTLTGALGPTVREVGATCRPCSSWASCRCCWLPWAIAS